MRVTHLRGVTCKVPGDSGSRPARRAIAPIPAIWVQGALGITFLFCPICQGRAVDHDLRTTTLKRPVITAGLEPEFVDAFCGHSLSAGAA